MGESICYVLSGGVSGWYIYVRYVDVFEFVEKNLCYLQFGFLYVDVGGYTFGRVCYVVFYQCDEAPSYFVASILSKCCIVVIELRSFVYFLKFCFLYGGYIYFVLV